MLRRIIKSIDKINQNLYRVHKKMLYNLSDVEVDRKIFSEKKVLNGPFKGLLYPDFFSAGSMLYPKLLGSYECEVHKIIVDIINSKYTQIIDIGCAEGYYAIGFALRCNEATVHAFDINEKAISYCRKMAKLNTVSKRVFTYLKCDTESLLSFNLDEKTFILADCEGYEKNLFTKENIHHFKNTDLLIEVHDFTDDSISASLLQLFNSSHYTHVISSYDDFQKPYLIDYPELINLSYNEKFQILAEKRPCIMQWFFFKAIK